MKSHIRKHHQFVGFYCSVCREGFVRDQELRKHVCTGSSNGDDSGSSATPPSTGNQLFRTAGGRNVPAPNNQPATAQAAPLRYTALPPGGPGAGYYLLPRPAPAPTQLSDRSVQLHPNAPPTDVSFHAPIYFLPATAAADGSLAPLSAPPSGLLRLQSTANGNPHPSAPNPHDNSPASSRDTSPAFGRPHPSAPAQQYAGLAFTGGVLSPEDSVSDYSEHSSPYGYVPHSPVYMSSPESHPSAFSGSQKRGRDSDEDDDIMASWLLSSQAQTSPQGISSQFVTEMSTLMSRFEEDPASFSKLTPALQQCYPYFKKMRQCVEEVQLAPTQDFDELYDFTTDFYSVPLSLPQQLPHDAHTLLSTHYMWSTEDEVVVEEGPVHSNSLVCSAPQTFARRTTIRFDKRAAGGHEEYSDSDEDENEEEDDTEDDKTVLEYSDDYCTESEGEAEKEVDGHDDETLADLTSKVSLLPTKNRKVKDLLDLLDKLILLGEPEQQ